MLGELCIKDSKGVRMGDSRCVSKNVMSRRIVVTLFRILLVFVLSGCAYLDRGQLSSTQPTSLVSSSTIRTKVVEVAFLLQDARTGIRDLALGTLKGLEPEFSVSTPNEVGAPSWRPGRDQFVYCEYVGFRSVLKLYDVSDRSSKTMIEDGRFNWLPVWSPDGSYIVYSTRDDISDEVGHARFRRLSLSSSVIEDLPGNSAIDYEQAKYGHTASELFALVKNGSTFEIWRLDLANNTDTRVLVDGEPFGFALSDDQQWVAYDSGGNLYTEPMDAAGVNARKIASDVMGYGWIPGRQQLVYAVRNGSGSQLFTASLPGGELSHLFDVEDWLVISLDIRR